jgi:hypothetical protein
MTVASIVAPVMADDAPKAETPATPAAKLQPVVLRGPYAEMARELKLTEEEKAKVAERIAARDAAIRQWEASHKVRFDELSRIIGEAKVRGDKRTVDVNAKEHQALRVERAALAERYEMDILKALPAEKQAAWHGYKAYSSAAHAYRDLKLTDAQDALMRERFLKAGEEIRTAMTDKARGSIVNDTRAAIEAEVLTDEQRAQLERQREAGKKPRAMKVK